MRFVSWLKLQGVNKIINFDKKGKEQAVSKYLFNSKKEAIQFKNLHINHYSKRKVYYDKRAKKYALIINSEMQSFLDNRYRATVIEKIIELINEHNPLGLLSYLDKVSPEEVLLSPQVFVEAFHQFLKAGFEDLKNSYKTLWVLHAHFYSHSMQKFYRKTSENYQNVFGLFNIFEKVSEGKMPLTIDTAKVKGVAGFQIDDYIKKVEDVQEKTLLRNMTKDIDNVLEEKLIYPIKYPKSANFIRKLLWLVIKRPANDVREDLENNIKNVVMFIKQALRTNSRYSDKNGNCIYSPPQINNLI